MDGHLEEERCSAVVEDLDVIISPLSHLGNNCRTAIDDFAVRDIDF